MSGLLLTIFLFFGALAIILALRQDYHLRLLGELEHYELRFPRDLTVAAVVTLLATMSGLRAAWWRRWLWQPFFIIEMHADRQGITHRLVVPARIAERVLAALRSTLPGIQLRPQDDVRPAVSRAVELGLSAATRPLRVERAAAANAAVLAGLQPLTIGERIVLQWLVRPGGLTRPVRLRPRRPRPVTDWAADQVTLVDDSEQMQAERAKRSEPLFEVVGRIGAAAGTTERASALVDRVVAGFHILNAPGVHLRRRLSLAALSARRLSGRRVPSLPWPLLLNAAELAGVVALPTDGLQLPGLALGGCRQLPPAAVLPRSGRVIGDATFPGAERPLAITPLDRLRHLHVIGPTGVGKSALLANLICQDIEAGAGVVVIDPKGDLVADVLDRIPDRRRPDVVVLDPTDAERPVGLNLLQSSADSPELVVDQVVGIMSSLWRAFWGPRTDDVLRAALLTLTHEPGMTLCEVPVLLTDPSFRRRLVGRLDDPIALEPFWAAYEAMSDAERAAVIGPVQNKLRAFLLRRRIRNVIGQANAPLDLDAVLSERKVLLVSLAKGLLGQEASALLGALVVARLWQATLGRAALPPAARMACYVHIDEFQDSLLHLPTTLADFLAQARGLGVGLSLAHQHLAQLPTAVRQAVLANARSRVVFQTAADDARLLAREFAPYLVAADLQGLGPYEIVASIAAGAQVAPPVTGRTRPLPPSRGTAERVRQQSRQRYGRPSAEIEAALRQRRQPRAPSAPVGRKRRSS